MSVQSCIAGLIMISLSSASLAEQIIVSNCLADKIKNRTVVLAKSAQFSLVETALDEELLDIIHANRTTCGKFLNIDPYKKQFSALTPNQILKQLTTPKVNLSTSSFTLSHEVEVKQLLQAIDPNKIWLTNQHLTSYTNRHSKSNTGLAAAEWFKQQFDGMAAENKRMDVDSYFIQTGKKYKQPSVVTLIGKDKPGEAVVIGAHIDTTSGNKPGADDDASGISVVLEMARVLLQTDIKLDRPVYLIAYAAEEEGLVGSSYVVQSFVNKKIPVKAVMQLDQAGYRANPKDTTIWLLDDYVDGALTKFNANLIKTYLKIPVAYTHCGYACSDHANWTDEGFKACYPSATTLDDDNPYVHTSADNLSILNLEHMVNFAKLGLAFVGELAID